MPSTSPTQSTPPPDGGEQAQDTTPSPTSQDRLAKLPSEILHKILGFITPEPIEMSTEMRVNWIPSPYVQQAYRRECWAEFLDRRGALLALSKTSKQYARLSLPLLYKRVVFSNRIKYIGVFLLNLLQHPERAQWVQQICWHLPHPLRDRGIIKNFKNHLQRKTFIPDEWSVSEAIQYQDALRCLTTLIKERMNDFPAFWIGIIGLPLLALTTNLTALTIWGLEPYPTAFHHLGESDPFFSFPLGWNTQHYQDTISNMLPDSIFGIQGGSNLIFPPQHLHSILFVSNYHLSYSYLVDRVFFNSLHSQRQLVLLSEAMRIRLDANLGPSGADGALLADASFISPSVILNASAEQYLDICEYLDKIATLPIILDGNVENWKSLVAWLKELPGDAVPKGTSLDLEALDRKYKKFTDTLITCRDNIRDQIPLFMNQDVECALERILISTNRPHPASTVRPLLRPGACKLKLWHPHHAYIDTAKTSVQGGVTLGDCLIRARPDLEVLDMAVRVYITNRQALYGDLDPSRFEHVRELTITIEALWGPLFTVMGMLEGNGIQKGLTRNNDSAAEEKMLSSELLWAMKRKAVERLPPKIEVLRILDWFAEYGRYKGDEEVDLASHLDQLITPTQDRLTDEDIENGGHYLDPKARTHFYLYPSGAGVWDTEHRTPNPYADDPRGKPGFARRYIQALFTALRQLSMPDKGSKAHGGLLVELRPPLKRLEFIYTLRDRKSLGDMHRQKSRADEAWRQWAASDKFRDWADNFGNRSGIEFFLWEGEVGNMPKMPEQPIVSFAVAKRAVIEGGDHNPGLEGNISAFGSYVMAG